MNTKKKLTSEFLLTHFNPDLQIIVASDASDYAIGRVICDDFKERKIKVVAHASITLIAAEKNIVKSKKEALVIFAVKNFRKIRL